MYICNFKLNLKKIFIIIITIALVIALIFEISSMSKKENKRSYDYTLTNENFTYVLRDVHNNIEDNIGKTIKLSGFVFRLPDFKQGYFVCGRNMLLDDDAKIVGFLCKYEGELNLNDAEWVEVTGIFEKGYYMTDMPVIKIDTINKITAPVNTYVETPDFL